MSDIEKLVITNLKVIDENEKPDDSFIRLDPSNTVERVNIELPTIRLGDKPPPPPTDLPKPKSLAKKRSFMPNVGSLIETPLLGKEDEWDEKKEEKLPIPWAWIALVACIFTIAITWSLVTSVNSEDKIENAKAKATTKAISNVEKEKSEIIDATLLVEALEKTVKDFFDARNVDELSKFIRHPERVRPLLDNFYVNQQITPKRVIQLVSFDPVTIQRSGAYWFVSVELENNETKDLLLEALSNQEAKVDWETFVNHQAMPWDDFIRERPENFTGDFRVFVEPDHFFSHEFADSNQFDSYRLSVPNSVETLFGYVEKNTELAQELASLTSREYGVQLPTLLLKLHLPENLSSRRGVMIKQVMSPLWLYLENPTNE